MMRLLSKLFNIRAAEWPRVLLLFLISVMTNIGYVWGTTIAYAAFLEQVGLVALPWVMVLSSVFAILFIAIYTAFVDRIPNDRLFIALYAVAIASMALGLALLWFNLPSIAYPVLYLLVLAWVAAYGPPYTTYVNSFYDIQSAKRILPVVSAGFRVGTIIGGLTMPLLTVWLAPSTIIVVWLLTYLVIMGLIWATPYLLREGKAQSDQGGHPSLAAVNPEKRRSSYLDNMREGFRYTTQSTYLRWMAIGTLLLMVLMALVEYRSSGLLLEIYGTKEKLASYLAILIGVGNIVVLPMLLLGLSRLIARLGLGNASMIFPVSNLLVCGGLILAPGLISATAAYFDRGAFRIVFQFPIDGLLYNAVPLRVKGRARAFVAGLLVPAGSLIGGLALFLPSRSYSAVSKDWFVPTFIGVLAVAYLVSAWFIRQQYGQALIKMLEQEDYSFLLPQEASELSVADPATLTWLQRKLEESTSYELTIFVAKLISQVGGSKTVPILGPAARAAKDARTRSAIVDVIVAADLVGDAVHRLYIDFLADPDGQVRQSAIVGLQELADPTDKRFLSQMLDMVQDPDIEVRVQALSALVHSGEFYRLTPAVQVLDQLLVDEDPYRKARGVYILGQLSDERAIRRLVDYVTGPADVVRLEAALAVEALSQPEAGTRDGGLGSMANSQIKTLVVERMCSLLQDPIERARQAALVVLGRMGTRESREAMVDALTDSSPRVRAAAAEALAQVGRSVIPLVHPKLNSPDPQLRNMATVVLGRVAPREFGALADSNIRGNLLTIYGNYGLVEALSACSSYPSIAVLQSSLREKNQRLVDEVFYLLTATHNPDGVKIVSESLRSESAHTRANATEALESLTTPQVANLIALLFEPGLPLSQLLSLGEETWDIEYPDTAKAIQQLVSHPDDLWLRVMTTFALGEIGAALREGDKPALSAVEGVTRRQAFPERSRRGDKETGGERRGRRSPPADLFEALISKAEDETEDEKAKVQVRRGDDAKLPFTLPEIEAMLEASLTDPVDDVRSAAQAALRVMADVRVSGEMRRIAEEDIVLSTIEKIIFLKEVPFFQGMTIDQLKVLANVCEEEFFEENTQIFNEGDPGGVLYVVVQGRVGIERETRRGSYARLATLGPHTYFGEMTLFDDSPRSATALALQDTLTLSLRREPLIALARQHPNLSIELIKVLSDRLRQTNQRITELTRSRPRELQKLFDKLD